MVIHYILLIVVFSICLIYRKKRDANKDNKNYKSNRILILAFVIMTLFIGLRTINIGTDTAYYVIHFLNNDYLFSGIEIMFPLVSKILHLVTNKYFIWLTLLSAISMLGIYNNAKHYKFDTEFFVFLYITSFCYIYSLSAIRFFCAFSIILFSFKYMINRDTKKVIILILLASLFHTTALIFIPMYFITKFKFKAKNIFIYASILFIIAFSFNIFNLENMLFNFDFFSQYRYVLDSQNDIGGLSAIMNVGILIFALLYYKNIKTYKSDYEFFIKMQIFAIGLDFVGIASRLIWFFKFPVWYIIPIIFVNIKEKRKKEYILLYLIFIMIYCAYYYFYLKNSLPSHNLLNYEFNMGFN